MALTIEWRRRIENFLVALEKLIYRPLGFIESRGFTTHEQLSYQDALKRKYKKMLPGTAWGEKWEYGWFQGEVILPEEAKGERIGLRLNYGGDALVWVNGQIAGSIDRAHREIAISIAGNPGKKYSILAEAYAGHGRISEGGGPVPYDVETVPEPGKAQVNLGISSFGVWEEALYQLFLDVRTLLELRDHLDEKSLRRAKIDRGLMEVTLQADLEAPHSKMIKSVIKGRECLSPLLDCVNGSTMPTMYAFGHAHLDVAWLWPLQETERKMARTLANQLQLMEDYPEFIFLQSQPHLYTMLKRKYPELYERVREKVKSGQIIAEGSSWVEPDTNLPGGESLIRQFMYGKKFFKDEFGVDCELFWEPDVFGYSGALPQILRGCGIKYFATAKLTWVYNGGDPFPYNIFTWEGIDGSEVLAHLFAGYGNRTSPADVIQNWNDRFQLMDNDGMFYGFGEGDGGGGATRTHLEYLRRERDLEGVPRMVMSSPLQFFKNIENQGWPNNRYVGELYYACHRGTYTSQARTKRYNRKCEIMLREAEFWAAVSQSLQDYTYPKKQLRNAWQTVLLNQFHDVLPGSSIARVYAEAGAEYEKALKSAREAVESSTACLTKPGSAITIFNSLSWPRTSLVELPDGYQTAASPSGELLNGQTSTGKTVVEVKLPACGWTTLELQNLSAHKLTAVKGVKTVPIGSDRFVIALLEGNLDEGKSQVRMENEFLRLRINEYGEIAYLFDKVAKRELITGPCNVFKMYKDVPTWFDAWDIDSMYQSTPVTLDQPAQVEVLSTGPLMATVRVTRTLDESLLIQDISLRRSSRRIDFATTMEWRERHKLLKVSFPVNLHANEAIHEIQFGHIKRPNHASRPFDADRFEVSNHKWTALVEENRGAAVLNDCKYGVNVAGNSINLTLLKSAMAPDMKADQGTQEFCYSLYTWNGSLIDSPVIQEAYDLNIPVWMVPGAAGEKSVFSVSAPNIVIETVKTGNADPSDLILRLYEAKRTATRCTLTTTLPVKSAHLTNMLEEPLWDLMFENGRIELDFRPFEIKTVCLKMK